VEYSGKAAIPGANALAVVVADVFSTEVSVLGASMRGSASVMAHTATVNLGGVDCNPPCLRLQRYA